MSSCPRGGRNTIIIKTNTRTLTHRFLGQHAPGANYSRSGACVRGSIFVCWLVQEARNRKSSAKTRQTRARPAARRQRRKVRRCCVCVRVYVCAEGKVIHRFPAQPTSQVDIRVRVCVCSVLSCIIDIMCVNEPRTRIHYI